MTAGDPQNCNLPGYPYWTGPYYQYPGYYHFRPAHNFCPCCGQRLNHNQLNQGNLSISPQTTQGADPQGYAGYNRNEPA